MLVLSVLRSKHGHLPQKVMTKECPIVFDQSVLAFKGKVTLQVVGAVCPKQYHSDAYVKK